MDHEARLRRNIWRGKARAALRRPKTWLIILTVYVCTWTLFVWSYVCGFVLSSIGVASGLVDPKSWVARHQVHSHPPMLFALYLTIGILTPNLLLLVVSCFFYRPKK